MKALLLQSVARAFWMLLLAACFSGCSTFHREWKQAAGPPPADDISGRWEGAWKSEATGHEGALRCVVTKESPERYRFLYRATWKKVLHGTYVVLQDVRREGNAFKMHGAAELGKLYGGRYEYDGQATPTSFFSTYRA
ncbi:MAG: hypothetical protein L0Z50_09210, partial [Verrucomicrobiales bacterium]|nr:hypothetical protein [Verrucomicrobiales bacterium]